MTEKIRILIVDDQTTMLENVADMVTLAPDMEVVGKASTGREGFMLAGQLKPDLILMDVMMPTIDGIATGRAIYRIMPKAKIILMSGEMEINYLWQKVLPQAVAYLEKPFSLDDLHTTVRRNFHESI